MNLIRVVLADDHTILRAGIRSLLQDVTGIEVVAEAADGLAALAMVQAHRPDVVLADIAMPGLNGLDLALRVNQEYPRTRVVVLTMHKDEEYVRRAVEVGAAGYLLKDSDCEELELALRAVARGATYLSPNASKYLITRKWKPMNAASEAPTCLTPRQVEVLKLIAEGNTTKAIARSLEISTKTVESHRGLLMERLGIFDVAGLVRYSIRVGLITSEE